MENHLKPLNLSSSLPLLLCGSKLFLCFLKSRGLLPPLHLLPPSDSVSLFQAMALAGNATDFANKKNVKIIHQTTEGSQIVRVNMNDADVLENPQYYLKPNDIIYVEPLSIKRYGFTSIPYSTIFSAASLLITVLTFFMYTSR